ncbi:MAG: glycosyltransferase family 2 protein [Candidatus Kapabacteria bacterium]|nr:glycosyltransferase family 2 protein [Candidatus Kapabacteria bacterium]
MIESIIKKIPKCAIVVPCYNEEEVLQYSSEILSSILKNLIAKTKISGESAICFVNDGSKDKTWEIIESLCTTDSMFKGISFSRNFGHQSSILAGMLELKDDFDCIITIDADLQDDTDLIEKFIDKFSEGCHIVYGVRRDRPYDTVFKKWTALLYYKILKVLGVDILYNHADYRLISKKTLTSLSDFEEVNLFLRGVFPLLGYKTDTVIYDRKERFAGETKYTFSKMFSLAINGITSFSVKPLRIISYLGFLSFFFSICISIWIIIEYYRSNVITGWTSVLVSIYFIGGISMISIGIIGEYIGKIYEEVKKRPRFIIEKKINI